MNLLDLTQYFKINKKNTNCFLSETFKFKEGTSLLKLKRYTKHDYYFSNKEKYILTILNDNNNTHTLFLKKYPKNNKQIIESLINLNDQYSSFNKLIIPKIYYISKTINEKYIIWMEYVNNFGGNIDFNLLKEFYNIPFNQINNLNFLNVLSNKKNKWLAEFEENLTRNNFKIVNKVFTTQRIDLIFKLYSQRSEVLEKLSNYKMNLLHQDLWSANIGFNSNKIVLYDLDNIGFGPYGCDISYCYYISILQNNTPYTQAIEKYLMDNSSKKEFTQSFYISFCLKPAYTIGSHLLSNILGTNKPYLFNTYDKKKLLNHAEKIFIKIEKGESLI